MNEILFTAFDVIQFMEAIRRGEQTVDGLIRLMQVIADQVDNGTDEVEDDC